VAWDRTHIFLVDERYLESDHPESNYGMLREALLRHVPIPHANVHRVPVESADAASVAASYEEMVASFFAPSPSAIPSFDLIFLGMGPDGHTASLFPGSPALAARGHIAAGHFVPAANVVRITLTLDALNAARTAAFLVTGEEKAATLSLVLAQSAAHPKPVDDRLPAARVTPAGGPACWIVDRAAASQLPT